MNGLWRWNFGEILQASDPRRKTGRCFSRSLKAEPENHFIERQIVKRNHLIWSLTASKMILNQNVNNSSSKTNCLVRSGIIFYTGSLVGIEPEG